MNSSRGTANDAGLPKIPLLTRVSIHEIDVKKLVFDGDKVVKIW